MIFKTRIIKTLQGRFWLCKILLCLHLLVLIICSSQAKILNFYLHSQFSALNVSTKSSEGPGDQLHPPSLTGLLNAFAFLTNSITQRTSDENNTWGESVSSQLNCKCKMWFFFLHLHAHYLLSTSIVQKTTSASITSSIFMGCNKLKIMTGNKNAHQILASINNCTQEPTAFPEDSVWSRDKNPSLFKHNDVNHHLHR